MRIGHRRKVVAIKAARPRTADPLYGFVEVEMMLAEVFADKHSARVTHRADSNARCSCGNDGGVKRRKSRPPAFLREYLVFETCAGIARAGNSGIALDGIVGETKLEFFGC